MRSRKRKIPEINSSSSADIAFLLLIFFLVTSSLDAGKGMYRRLPSPIPEEAMRKKMDIRERNLLTFSIDSVNQVFCGDEPIAVSDIKSVAREFIANPNNRDYLPEKQEKEIAYFGLTPITSNHTISLKVSREANYQTYMSVQNELAAAYNELRNELSLKQFHTAFDRLTDEQQTSVREIYPQHISETEPDSTGKEVTNE